MSKSLDSNNDESSVIALQEQGGETKVLCRNNQSQKKKIILPDVTDKGYAWVIIAAMWVSNVISAGYIKSFGITYNAIVDLYPDTSAGSGSIIVGLLAGCRSILALAVGAASVQFGARPVMMFGVLLCATGLFSAHFCYSIGTLAITLGAMMGIGMCCIETPQVVVLSQYFTEKKELANSFRVSGNPLGGALVPFVLVFLFESFGVQLSFIVLSGIMIQLSVIIFLQRPYKTHQKIVYNQNKEKIRQEELNKPPVSGEDASCLEIDMKVQEEEVKETPKAKRIDLKLLTNALYWTHIMMITFLSISLPQLQYFLPLYGRSVHMSPIENSVILAYQSVSDSCFRLTLGALFNKKLFKKTHAFSFCLITGGIGIALMPLTSNLWTMLITVTMFSMGSAGYFATINPILIDQFGKANVSSSWGFIRMLQGFLNFAYPPMLGAMVDYTGGFVVTFLTMGFGMTMAGVSIALQPCVIKFFKVTDVQI